MSTYLSTFNKRKGTGLSVWASYCVLSGLFTLLMLFCTLVLSPIALGARKDSTQPEYLLRAGVAVVRVVATYNAPSSLTTDTKNLPSGSAPPSPVSCTGLGVVVASWSGSQTERNTYVLTDGSLVNKQELTCGSIPTPLTPPSGPGIAPTQPFRLSQIRVYYSTAYNSTLQPTTLNTVDSVVCSAEPCSDGAALFSFHSSTPMPLVTVAANNNASLTDAAALQLNISSSKIATPSAPSDSQQFLNPTSLPLTSSDLDTLSTTFEGGTPIVDAKGTLNKLYLKNGTTGKFARPADIRALMDSQNVTTMDAKHPDAVNDAWQSGMNAYVLGQGHYPEANKAFQQAYRASNSQFQGAQTLVDATNPGSQQGNATAPGTHGESNAGIPVPLIGTIPYLLLAIGAIGLVILILLLIVLNLIFRRAQREKEFQEADKQATIEAQHIREREAQQAAASAVPPGIHPLSQQPTPSYAAQQMSTSTASIPPSLVPLAPATSVQSSAVADQPTIDLSEAQRNGVLDVDKTQPFSPTVQRATNMNNSEEHVSFEIIAKTNPGIKRQHKPNEDSMFAIRGMRNENGQAQQIGLFVVADGMGGHADGQDASRLAIQTIIDYLLPRLSQGEDTRESAQKLLVDSIQLANQAVHQHNVEQNADMGTTVTATLVIDEMAHVANVGDSRTYLYRVSDGLTRVTRDHSVVASLVDAGIIKPDDIYTHPKRNQIYRSLGEKPFVEVDPFTVQLHPGDKLLLCSDGLWEMVRDPEIQRVLEMPTSNPQQLGENLISAALKSGGEDNVSVMVVNVVDQASNTPTSGLEPVYVQDNIKIPSL